MPSRERARRDALPKTTSGTTHGRSFSTPLFPKRDPVPRYRDWLIENQKASEAELVEIEEAVDQEIAEAVAFARESPEPTPDTALDYIYA